MVVKSVNSLTCASISGGVLGEDLLGRLLFEVAVQTLDILLASAGL